MNVFCPLASGSKGNCIYLEINGVKLLVDAGISFSEIENRLSSINVSIYDIEAILITHDHLDHIAGLKTFSSRMKDVYIFSNLQTAKGIKSLLQVELKYKIFTTDEPFEYKGISFYPFSIMHDTQDPVGYLISIDKKKIGICTDLGFATSIIKNHLKNCNYLYLEANHDENMLFASKRPEFLKKRIASRYGHLSNNESIKLIKEIMSVDLKHIFLAHLSSECNSEKHLQKSFIDTFKNEINFDIAYQDKISNPLYF